MAAVVPIFSYGCRATPCKKTLFFCVFGYPLIINAKSAEIVDRIVAVVNDDVITLIELNSSLKPYTEKIGTLGYPPEKEQELLFKVRKDMLDRLINQKIEDQEIKRSKVEISEEQIDQTIERIKETNYLTDEQLRAALAKDGLTIEEYRKKIKSQILRTRLVNLKVKSKIVITNEDVKAYYEEHIEEYGGKQKYHLRNIIMRVPLFSDTKKKLEIQAKMDEILERTANLPARTVVLYLIVLKDGAGKEFVGIEALSQIASVSSAPVYSFWDASLGHGIVGGYLSCFEKQAEVVAEVVAAAKQSIDDAVR